MKDMFASLRPGLESPPGHIFTVVPDDATDLPMATRAINVATSGVIRLTTTEGETADLFVSAGMAFPIRASRIWQTGTTASGIIGLY